jgi:hypothetical protein
VRSIETRSDRPSLMNPARQIVCPRSPHRPSLHFTIYYAVVHCFLHDDRSRRKQKTKNTQIKKRTGTAKPEIRPQHRGCFSVAFGVALHFGSMKAIVVTQATTHTHTVIQTSQINKISTRKKAISPTPPQFVTLKNKKRPQFRSHKMERCLILGGEGRKEGKILNSPNRKTSR